MLLVSATRQTLISGLWTVCACVCARVCACICEYVVNFCTVNVVTFLHTEAREEHSRTVTIVHTCAPLPPHTYKQQHKQEHVSCLKI